MRLMVAYLMRDEKNPGLDGGSSTLARILLLGIGVACLVLLVDFGLVLVFTLDFVLALVLAVFLLFRNGGFMVISLELV